MINKALEDILNLKDKKFGEKYFDLNELKYEDYEPYLNLNYFSEILSKLIKDYDEYENPQYVIFIYCFLYERHIESKRSSLKLLFPYLYIKNCLLSFEKPGLDPIKDFSYNDIIKFKDVVDKASTAYLDSEAYKSFPLEDVGDILIRFTFVKGYSYVYAKELIEMGNYLIENNVQHGYYISSIGCAYSGDFIRAINYFYKYKLFNKSDWINLYSELVPIVHYIDEDYNFTNDQEIITNLSLNDDDFYSYAYLLDFALTNYKKLHYYKDILYKHIKDKFRNELITTSDVPVHIMELLSYCFYGIVEYEILNKGINNIKPNRAKYMLKRLYTAKALIPYHGLFLICDKVQLRRKINKLIAKILKVFPVETLETYKPILVESTSYLIYDEAVPNKINVLTYNENEKYAVIQIEYCFNIVQSFVEYGKAIINESNQYLYLEGVDDLSKINGAFIDDITFNNKNFTIRMNEDELFSFNYEKVYLILDPSEIMLREGKKIYNS